MVDKTYTARQEDIEAEWWVVDAAGETLGRLSTRVASILRGKHHPDWSPHLDHRDHVIVVNASKVAVTGRKRGQKRYYRHSGYPGGLREETLDTLLARHPERVIEAAVRGMLPPNKLRRQLLGNLRVYRGPDHPHKAQQPRPLEITSGTTEGQS